MKTVKNDLACRGWFEWTVYRFRRWAIARLAGSDSVVANIYQVGGGIFLRGRGIVIGEWLMEKNPPEGSGITNANIAQGVRMIPPTKRTGF